MNKVETTKNMMRRRKCKRKSSLHSRKGDEKKSHAASLIHVNTRYAGCGAALLFVRFSEVQDDWRLLLVGLRSYSSGAHRSPTGRIIIPRIRANQLCRQARRVVAWQGVWVCCNIGAYSPWRCNPPEDTYFSEGNCVRVVMSPCFRWRIPSREL